MMRSIALILVLASATATASVEAQTPGQSPSAAVPDRPGVVYADRVRTTATVDAVDRAKRTVTLKAADGRTVTLQAPPEARNFDQLEVGDKVGAEYIEAIAIFVRKSDAPPAAGQTTKVSVAPKGEKPAATVVETVELTARVEAIDAAARTVTLRGPEGRVRTIKVDDRVQRLEEVKPGDEVVVRHTEALAIAFSQ
ncbi:MAG TPA: hypothetical protein VF136_14160 [Methylomirabilota bacterium]|jgi:hypothetical protein